MQVFSLFRHLPPLPGLTPDGKRIIVMRGKDKDIDTPPLGDVAKVVLMIGDVRLAAEETGVAGDVYILDASVASASHFSKVSPSLAKKFLVCVQVNWAVSG